MEEDRAREDQRAKEKEDQMKEAAKKQDDAKALLEEARRKKASMERRKLQQELEAASTPIKPPQQSPQQSPQRSPQRSQPGTPTGVGYQSPARRLSVSPLTSSGPVKSAVVDDLMKDLLTIDFSAPPGMCSYLLFIYILTLSLSVHSSTTHTS